MIYLYRIYDINKNCVLEFKSEYLNCFEVMEILRQDINYVSCTREKILDKQLSLFDSC